MKGTIFYRERRKIEEGERKPRFRVVAVSGADLKVFATHLRLEELRALAAAVGAELMPLEAGGGEEGHEHRRKKNGCCEQ